MKTILLLPVLSLWLLLATQANAQVYHLHLSDNTCRITECVDTPQGVKPLGQTWKGNTFHDRFTLDSIALSSRGKGRKRDVCQQDHQPHCQIRSPLIHHGADYRQPHHQQPSSRPSTYPLSEWPMDTSHLFLRDRELTAHANIYNIYHLYLIFVLFICE